ncbi:MAG: hypothetical protein IJI43_03080 [Bacilli bacterium]|nr:hypothetical protein [Bacilli bacterium]
MKEFIVSDLHGDGNAYDSIMGYLNNYKKCTGEDVTLYINGDLIDRGEDSARMLVDVYDRIKNGSDINIKYLAGNHELMMYQASLKILNNTWPTYSDWFCGNGGDITAYKLDDMIDVDKEDEIIDYISTLKIYKKFDYFLNDKQMVLVHAKCPDVVLDHCPITISDNNQLVEDTLWKRHIDFWTMEFSTLGNPKYFTVLGHTPVDTKTGFRYDSGENYLNIDGGCACYACGDTSYDHIPVVEIEDNHLKILTFDNNNHITHGNYFDGVSIIPMNDDELKEDRNLLDKNVKVKKLTIYR